MALAVGDTLTMPNGGVGAYLRASTSRDNEREFLSSSVAMPIYLLRFLSSWGGRMDKVGVRKESRPKNRRLTLQ